MPCCDSRDDREYSALVKRLDAATRAACELGCALELFIPWGIISKYDVSEETVKWFKEHKQLDKERK